MFKNLSALTILFLFFLHSWLAVAANQKLLEDIQFETPSDDEERITFKLNGTYIPKIFALKGEKPRVVFDFPDTKTARLLNNIINTNGKFIKRIRIGIHGEPHPKTRVVFDLIEDKEIDFKQKFDTKKNALIITVHYAGTEPEKKPAPPKKEQTAQPPEQAAATVAPPENITPPAAPVQEAVQEKKKEKEKKKPESKKTSPPQAAVNKQSATPEAPESSRSEQDTKSQQPTEEPAVTQPAEKQPSVPAQAPQETVAGSTPVLSAITFDDSTNRGEMILFKLNKFHPPIVFGVEEGQPRVVCDFKETVAAQDLPNTITTGGKYIHTIRVGKKKNPQEIRVVLDLAPSNSYDLQQVFFKNDNLFVIIVNVLHNTPPADELEKPLK